MRRSPWLLLALLESPGGLRRVVELICTSRLGRFPALWAQEARVARIVLEACGAQRLVAVSSLAEALPCVAPGAGAVLVGGLRVCCVCHDLLGSPIFVDNRGHIYCSGCRDDARSATRRSLLLESAEVSARTPLGPLYGLVLRPGAWECSVCLQATVAELVSAQQCPNGHLACGGCLERMPLRSPCPICRSSGFTWRSATVFHGLNLRVACFVCGVSMEAKLFRHHAAYSCPARTVACPFCGMTLEIQFLERHLLSSGSHPELAQLDGRVDVPLSLGDVAACMRGSKVLRVEGCHPVAAGQRLLSVSKLRYGDDGTLALRLCHLSSRAYEAPTVAVSVLSCRGVAIATQTILPAWQFEVEESEPLSFSLSAAALALGSEALSLYVTLLR